MEVVIADKHLIIELDNHIRRDAKQNTRLANLHHHCRLSKSRQTG